MYLTQARCTTLIPDLTARFQVSHLRTSFPTEGTREVNIPYVRPTCWRSRTAPGKAARCSARRRRSTCSWPGEASGSGNLLAGFSDPN